MAFPVIGVCDGLAMGHTGMKYSLASRELIADSIEVMAMAHPFDGLVFLPNCDKIVPGMLMAALRLDLPCLFVSGGPMLAGHAGGQPADLISVFEGVGALRSGRIKAGDLKALEDAACPGCGSCAGMFTANSMNCLTEAIGLALPGNGTIPAVHAARRRLAKTAGAGVMALVKRGLRPRRIARMEAFRNAMTIGMALGCSTAVLHLPAIAHEGGADARSRPLQCHQRADAEPLPSESAGPTTWGPGPGRRGARRHEDLAPAGLLDLKALTVTGRTLGETLRQAVTDREVIRPLEKPFSATVESPF